MKDTAYDDEDLVDDALLNGLIDPDDFDDDPDPEAEELAVDDEDS